MAPIAAAPFGALEIATSSVCLAFDAVVVGLRLWARVITKRRHNVGDYLIVYGLIITLARFGTKLSSYYAIDRGSDGAFSSDPHSALLGMRLTFAADALYMPAVVCVKISILLSYREFFRVLVWVNRIIWFMIFICVFVFALTLAGLLTQCSPVVRSYDRKIPGSCRSYSTAGVMVLTITNPVIDFILVVIPLSVVWSMKKMTRMQKVGVSFMFGLGTLIVFITTLRAGLYRNEPGWKNRWVDLLLSLELHLGILAACLPFIGLPLVRIGAKLADWRVFHKVMGTDTTFSLQSEVEM